MKEMTKDKLSITIAGVERSPLLVHYGATSYLPEKVLPIENSEYWVKPKRGGLWTSPVDSTWGWKHWNDINEFRECREDNSFTIQLAEDAKIFVIDSLEDLKNAPLIKNFRPLLVGRPLDFELIAKTYDAIWLTEKGQEETHLSHPTNLYGWDCESVLVLNPDRCFEIDKKEVGYEL